MPIEVAVQKLRGFISDQDAKIIKADENELILEVTDRIVSTNRRKTDRSVTFVIEMQFSQRHVERANTQGLAAGKYLETSHRRRRFAPAATAIAAAIPPSTRPANCSAASSRT